jgi:hypothetical protein
LNQIIQLYVNSEIINSNLETQFINNKLGSIVKNETQGYRDEKYVNKKNQGIRESSARNKYILTA